MSIGGKVLFEKNIQDKKELETGPIVVEEQEALRIIQ